MNLISHARLKILSFFTVFLFFFSCGNTSKTIKSTTRIQSRTPFQSVAEFFPKDSTFVARFQIAGAFDELIFYKDRTNNADRKKAYKKENAAFVRTLKSDMLSVFGVDVFEAEEVLVAGNDTVGFTFVLTGVPTRAIRESTKYFEVRRIRDLVVLYPRKYASHIRKNSGLPVEKIRRLDSASPFSLFIFDFSWLPIKPDLATLTVDSSGLIQATVTGDENALDQIENFINDQGAYVTTSALDDFVEHRIFSHRWDVLKNDLKLQRNDGEIRLESVFLEPIVNGFTPEIAAMAFSIYLTSGESTLVGPEIRIVTTKTNIAAGENATRANLLFKRIPAKDFTPNMIFARDLTPFLSLIVENDKSVGDGLFTSDFSTKVLRHSGKRYAFRTKKNIKSGTTFDASMVKIIESDESRLPENILSVGTFKNYLGRRIGVALDKGSLLLLSDFSER